MVEEAPNTDIPNTVVYLGRLDTGLVFRGHVTFVLLPRRKYQCDLKILIFTFVLNTEH